MISFRSVIIFILFLNIIGVGLIVFYTQSRNSATAPAQTVVPGSKTAKALRSKIYTFDDPILAYYILKQIDPYEPIAEPFADIFSPTTPHMGLKRDPDYCLKSLAYFIDHPEVVFLQKNFFTDFTPKSLVRGKVLRLIGHDVMPEVGYHLKASLRKARVFDLKVNINSYYTNGGLHRYQLLGKEAGCNHQLYNHILGVIALNSKTHVAQNYYNYRNNYENKPHCVDEFFPETFVLTDEAQCKKFFEYFNSPQYKVQKEKDHIVYMKKIGYGAHKGKGVIPLDDDEEKKLKEQYADGALCGTDEADHNYQMQRYIPNPLLLEGHKFDFRIYMVIASTNPLILYYHDGFLRLSLYKYDPTSKEKAVHLTNTDLSSQIWAKVKEEGWNGMNETELRNFQMWNFTKLYDYLTKHGKITDPNWLDNSLRFQIQQAMAHIGRMTNYRFLKRSNHYELFGIDFLLDDNLKIWFIECNSGPVLKGTSEEKERFLVKMLSDHFQLMFGYLRSRMKRVITFVNKIMHELPPENIYPDTVIIPELDQKKAEFKRLSTNYLEPEYTPDAGNGFVKVIDENLKGVERYAGYIKEDCL